SVGSWLYKVAQRVARRAKAVRRRLPVPGPAAPAPPGPLDDLSWREVLGVLHEELRRLPDRLSAPLLLCYWEGGSHPQAAARLGWKLGTFKDRLERARELLRRRLARRGLAGALPALLLAQSRAPAAPALLAEAAGRAVRFAAGGATSSPAVALADGTLS